MQSDNGPRRESPAKEGWKGAVYQVPSAGLNSRYPPIGRHILYTLLTIGVAVLLLWVLT